MQVIDMEMNDVELVRAPEDSLQHDEMMRHLVLTILIQAQCAPARRHQVRFRLRIAARKERDFVALSHQFLCEIRHHAFCSAVVFRWHTFIKRRHLCNFHTRIEPYIVEISRPSAAGSMIAVRMADVLSLRLSIRPTNLSRLLYSSAPMKTRARSAFPVRWMRLIRQHRAPPSMRWRFANNFARLFIFAQPHEDGGTQFSVSRPLIHSLPASSPATLAGLTVYVAALPARSVRLAPRGLVISYSSFMTSWESFFSLNPKTT